MGQGCTKAAPVASSAYGPIYGVVTPAAPIPPPQTPPRPTPPCAKETKATKDLGSGNEAVWPRILDSGETAPDTGETAWQFSSRMSPMHQGAPMPSDECERCATLKSLDVLDTEPEQRFDDITKLCCTVFKVPICLVSIVDSDRQWFKSVQGLGVRSTPRSSSFCAWTLLPACPKVLVVQDSLEDVRFCRNPLVLDAPYIRFYAGAPLIASDGKRLGSLCIIDSQPRTFDPESCTLLVNFGEMVARELERDKMLLRQRKESEALSQENRLLRAFSHSKALLLCNVSDPDWPMLFINRAWESETGMPKVQADSALGFWAYFTVNCPDDEFASVIQTCRDAILQKQTFNLTVAPQQQGTPDDGAGDTTFLLQFRCANTAIVDDSMPLIGIPSTVHQGEPNAMQNDRVYYYAKVLQRDSAGSVSPGQCSDAGAAQHAFAVVNEKLDPFDDVRLGALLGCGAYGRVYRGQWNDATVAVKVIEHAKADSRELVEALLTSQISHPNVVETFKHCSRAMPSAAEELSHRLWETWIIMEMCDQGCLSDAAEAGWFRLRGSLFEVDFAAILHTAKDVVGAMAYLHSRNILHGDLTGQNILLTASTSGGRFSAKVADFGLSRVLEGTTTKTKTHGSISHTAPELLLDGTLSKAADVYAFGLILWELFMGQRPYMGMNQAQIIHHISSRRSLSLSIDCPAGFRAMVTRCCNTNFEKRPTFDDLVLELDALSDDLC